MKGFIIRNRDYCKIIFTKGRGKKEGSRRLITERVSNRRKGSNSGQRIIATRGNTRMSKRNQVGSALTQTSVAFSGDCITLSTVGARRRPVRNRKPHPKICEQRGNDDRSQN